MSRGLRYTVICVLSALGLIVGGCFGFRNFLSEPPPPKLTQLEEIELPDVEKKIRRGDEWLGKIVVVNHWATWCAPCREEIPMLIEYQESMQTQGIQVVGIAHDLLDAARIFGDEIGINYPSLVAIVDGSKLLATHGNSQSGALPFTIVFDRGGHPAGTKLGLISHEELQQLVDPLL